MSSLEGHVDVPQMSDTRTKVTDTPQTVGQHEAEALVNGHNQSVNLEPVVDAGKTTTALSGATETEDSANSHQTEPSTPVMTGQASSQNTAGDGNGDSVASVGLLSDDVTTNNVNIRDAETEVPRSDTETDNTSNAVSSQEAESNVGIREAKLLASDKIEEDVKLRNSDESESPEDAVNAESEDQKSSQQNDDNWILVLGHEKLKKKKLKPGDGLSSRPQRGDIVTVSYSAKLDDGTEVDRRDRHVFTQGDGDVIQALDLCVALMELHEVCTVVTEAQYAYGAKGREPDIPPNARLTYTIELLNVEEAPDYSTWTIKRRIEEGNKKKERGNELYSRGEFSFAINSYTKALAVLDDSNETTHDASVEDLQLLLDTRMTCYNNLAAAQIKVEAWDAAIQSCDEVLKKQAENVKALFRKGKCLSNKGELEMAIVHLQKALKLEPGSKIIHQELVRLKAKNRSQDKSQAAMYQRMFWGGNKKSEKQTREKSHWWWYVGGAISAAALSLSLAAYRYLHM